MPMAPLDLLRLYVDDAMPTDGSDPMFTDVELQAALDDNDGKPTRAAVEVWGWKAAKAAALVDVVEGNAARSMSDMQSHALNMVKFYETKRSTPTDGRTTIGRIQRRYY